MIPKLHDKTGTVIGDLTDCLKGITIEERNGMLEAEITYQLFSPHWDKLIRGNIFTADVNDKIKNQQFRIYKVGKTIKGVFNVYARHISYDAQRDMIEGLDIQNQSCEYCLNMIFRNSQFSQKFRGHSDIVNAQNFKIGSEKLLSAIAGTKGSIIDTFGTGAEILRDNYDFYVFNKRGNDNGVTIEYSKNMTGLDYTEDEEGLITRIKAIAKYTPEGGEETEIFTYVDSPKILDYETPFIETIDFSDKFEDGEIPTTEKLKTLGVKYFNDNKCDLVKFNYKISFIPLSKCIGYEDIQDKIELCDTVGIKDYRYNLDTKAKVIKTTYDFLRERYDSMEVGEPRTTLGDVVGGGSEESKPGPPGPQGPPGADGNIGDFPDSLPSVPVLSSKLYGFSSIELSWTYENKVYYNYELYASKTKDFTPNTFDLIHQGQSSSFLFQAKPNETWYFRVCAINSHGNRTPFSDQVIVTTKKVDDLSNYVDNMAINDALIGTLSLDRGWIGRLNANYLDVKGNFSVTNGNGIRTIDIDSFGDIILQPRMLKVLIDDAWYDVSNEIQYQGNAIAKLEATSEGIKTEVSKKLGVDEVKSTIQQNPTSVKVGFNGINDNVTMTEESMDFKYPNGNTSMRLYGGQMCVYNPHNNSFLGTIGTIGNKDNTFKGVGFISSMHCQSFTIDYDPNWDNVNTNREPSTTPILRVNFDNASNGLVKGVHCALPLHVSNDIFVKGRVLANTFWDVNNSRLLFVYDGYNMINNTGWDWNGNNLVNARLIACDISSISDRTKKENIRYIKENSNTISNKEMFDFITQDYSLAQYNYIGKEDERISAIAQDLLVNADGSDNAIGQMIVNNIEALESKKENRNICLSINQTQLLNTLIGAFQEYVKVTDKKIEELEKKLNIN